MKIAERDAHAIWHPFTQHQMSELPLTITHGKGVYLYDENGKRYLDLISSWWVNLHGHANPDIAMAIYQQALKLEHVNFSNLTHEPAVVLAEELLNLLPNTFSKVFYSDNGSTAIEIALKMAYQYWRNQGNLQRTRFIAFKNGYHGDTFGSMAVSQQSGFFSHFEDLFFQVDFFSFPATWLNDENVLQKEQSTLQEIANYLEQFGSQCAALIIEPLVQGAGGMNMCTTRFLQQLENLMRSHNILIIYDEVMTGFGRTGDIFACKKANTSPDIICLSKGLSGGFLPLAATICHEKIYEAFLGNNFSKALAHGHTFTANPLGCAAAIASLKLLKNPEIWEHITMIETVHRAILEAENFSKARVCGTIAAFDLNSSMEYGSASSVKLKENLLKKGLIVRPLGNVIYFLPPYCITENELRFAYELVVNEIEGVMAC